MKSRLFIACTRMVGHRDARRRHRHQRDQSTCASRNCDAADIRQTALDKYGATTLVVDIIRRIDGISQRLLGNINAAARGDIIVIWTWP